MNHEFRSTVYAVLLGVLISGCALTPAETSRRQVHLLHINDVYRIAGVDGQTKGGIDRLRTLRKSLEKQHEDLLITHAGDFLFPSTLSREFNGEQMVDLMNQLDGASDKLDKNLVVTFGNHEFDKDKLKHAAILNERINESEFYWLSSNIQWKNGADGQPLVASDRLAGTQIRTLNGVKLGLFGLTTNLKVPEYADIDTDYVGIAKTISAKLRRQGAEVVIALTHLRMTEDRQILDSAGSDGPDLIVGGHEHNKQSYCTENNRRCVIKADADIRSAALITLNVDDNGQVSVDFDFKDVDEKISQDPKIKALAERWDEKYSKIFCDRERAPSDCLSTSLGSTRVKLIGEELEIRRYETNLGNFILDQALAAYRPQGAQIAFINSGSLRLNQDIPANSPLTERSLREIFQYPTQLKLVKITGKQLQQIIDHSIEDWTGNGWWLQIAGFRFVHDVERQQARGLTLIDNGSPRSVTDEESIIAVTNDYIMDPSGNRDGYTMIDVSQEIPVSPSQSLLDRTRQAIEQAGAAGIAPVVDQRICSTDRHDCSPLLQ